MLADLAWPLPCLKAPHLEVLLAGQALCDRDSLTIGILHEHQGEIILPAALETYVLTQISLSKAELMLLESRKCHKEWVKVARSHGHPPHFSFNAHQGINS